MYSNMVKEHTDRGGVELFGFRVTSAKATSPMSFGTTLRASCASSWRFRSPLYGLAWRRPVCLHRNKPLRSGLPNPSAFVHTPSQPNKTRAPLQAPLFYLAERVGFEPTVTHNATPDFESGTFDHSDTSPGWINKSRRAFYQQLEISCRMFTCTTRLGSVCTSY